MLLLPDKIIKLTPEDVKLQSYHWATFKEVVARDEGSYPKINQWLHTKVAPGIVTGERVAFIAYHDSQPIVTAAIKHGEPAKFCRLKVDNAYHLVGIGELFIALMTFEVSRLNAKGIYFTFERTWY